MKKPPTAKIERNKILIRDVPYVYIDTSLIQGDIDEVSKNILNLRNILKEAYESRKKDLPFSHTPFEDYKYIHLYYDEFDISLKVFRDESDEEFEKRLDANNKRSESAKLAAKNRKNAQEKRERTLFENLKKKYG